MSSLQEDPQHPRTQYRYIHPWGFDGVAYVRWIKCPRDDVPTVRATGGELADGAVLPVKWGGVATARSYDPRLQDCTEDDKTSTSGMAVFRTVWKSINV
jgi:hypothetical protein